MALYCLTQDVSCDGRRQTTSQVGISSTYLAMVMVNVIARPTLQNSCLDGRFKEGEDSNWEGCGKKISFLLLTISTSELTPLRILPQYPFVLLLPSRPRRRI